jgi:polygalacturonase
MKHRLILAMASWLYFSPAAATTYNILDYKAKADARTVNTLAIQQAVDDCAAHGGGIVLVPAGTFVTGMIVLKSNVNLHLDAGAVLQADAGRTDYTSLVLIDSVEHVSITGEGILFGNGKKFVIKEAAPGRPYIVFARNSRDIVITDITLKHPASWTLRLSGCEHVMVRGVSIYSHANFNNDGIDIDSKDVVISGCIIDSGDDAICLKSDDASRLCENITISNCIASSNCNLIKMGTGSYGGFRNISVSNCVLRHASESPLHHWNASPDHFISDSITGISGIALEVVDGGILDQVSISNITMTGVQTPIFIRLGSRSNGTGTLKNVIISNIVATSGSRMTSTIAAVPGAYIENVILRDIIINGKGGGTIADAQRKVPESENGYPENRMFGWSLPAYGLYVRHVKNLTLDNVQFNLSQPDARPAVWLEDAHEVKTTGLRTSGKTEPIRQVNTSDVTFDQTLTVTPARAYDYVDGIGVNTHLRFAGVYATAFDSIIFPKLKQSGIKHIRDALPYDGFLSASQIPLIKNRFIKLFDSCGIKVSYLLDNKKVVDSLLLRDSAAYLSVFQTTPHLNATIQYLEGFNEPDLSIYGWDTANWHTLTYAIQKGLWNKAHSMPELSGINVVSASLVTYYNAARMGRIAALTPYFSNYSDYANYHPYDAGGQNTNFFPGYTYDWNKRNTGMDTIRHNKPWMITEIGYENALNWNLPSSPGYQPASYHYISELAAGKYYSVLFMEMFKRGAKKVYGYEFIDLNTSDQSNDANNFGIIHTDGTEKPAFRAIRNTLSILHDDSTSFALSPLTYTLSGDMSGINNALYQKINGHYYLALWQGITKGVCYDFPNFTDIPADSQSVQIVLPFVSSRVNVYQPLVSGAPIYTYTNKDTITVQVPDHLLLIEIAPAGADFSQTKFLR